MKIAVVEDCLSDLERLSDCIKKFFEEKSLSYEVISFDSGLKFLDRADEKFDVVFMDIELPDCGGMETAKRLREKNQSIIIVFVTNLAQYAVDGYLVDALDYIVKPVNYGGFKLRMERVLKKYNADKVNEKIMVRTESANAVLYVNDISYVEVMGHMVVYHTLSGGKTETKNSLSNVTAELKKYGFVSCNRCYLVNLRHVKRIEQESVIVGNEKLIVSRGKRKELVKAVTDYLSTGGKNG